MSSFRYKIDKKIGYRGVEFRYGKGCMCSWLKMQVRIPEDRQEREYIESILKNL